MIITLPLYGHSCLFAKVFQTPKGYWTVIDNQAYRVQEVYRDALQALSYLQWNGEGCSLRYRLCGGGVCSSKQTGHSSHSLVPQSQISSKAKIEDVRFLIEKYKREELSAEVINVLLIDLKKEEGWGTRIYHAELILIALTFHLSSSVKNEKVIKKLSENTLEILKKIRAAPPLPLISISQNCYEIAVQLKEVDLDLAIALFQEGIAWILQDQKDLLSNLYKSLGETYYLQSIKFVKDYKYSESRIASNNALEAFKNSETVPIDPPFKYLFLQEFISYGEGQKETVMTYLSSYIENNKIDWGYQGLIYLLWGHYLKQKLLEAEAEVKLSQAEQLLGQMSEKKTELTQRDVEDYRKIVENLHKRELLKDLLAEYNL